MIIIIMFVQSLHCVKLSLLLLLMKYVWGIIDLYLCSICHWYGPIRRQRVFWTVSQGRRSRFLAERRLIGAVEGMTSPYCHTWWRLFDDRSPWSDQWLVYPMHQTFRWPPARNQRHRWCIGTRDTFLSLRLPQHSQLRHCMLSRDTSQKYPGFWLIDCFTVHQHRKAISAKKHC